MATGLRGAGGNYGAGSNRYGSDPKLGGGGKGSGSSRGTGGGSKASGSPSGGVSTGGGLRGAGGNYGPGSGRPGSSSGGSKTNNPTGGTSRVDRSLMGMGSSRLGSSALGGVAKQAQNNVSRTGPNTVGPGRSWDNVLNTPYNTVFPTRAPVTGVAQSFPGRPRPGKNALGVSRVHAGLDFGVAPNGAPVTPTVPGKVIQVANSPSAYGPTVQVMNTFGGIDRYALHKSQNVPVKVGQSVYPGTVLGTAGKLPGKPSNFSHLHYENITAQDPAYRNIVRGMQDGTLAKNKTGVAGSTSSYSKTDIRSSTPDWARSAGLTQGTAVTRGAALAPPGIGAGVQVAGLANAGVPTVARQMRAADALKTLQRQSVSAPQVSMAGNERTVAPGHWGREEVDYLTKIGAMDRIKRDPFASAGYREIQNPDGSGMRIGSDTHQLGMTFPGDNMTNVNVKQPPETYGNSIAHELGHVGSYRADPYKFVNDIAAEERRQYAVDKKLARPSSYSQKNAENYLRKYGSVTPLGSLPAAPDPKPKDIKLAWDVPPMGGAMIPGVATPFGVWGTNRPINDPNRGANPGTIHSQTADAAPSGSWMDGIKKQAQNLGLDPDKVITVGTDAVKKLADGNKKVADVQRKYGRFSDFLFKMAGGGPGAASNSAFGNPQDRRPPYYPPVMSQPQQVAEVPQQTDPLSTLNNLMANMRAKGATPQQIAYVQTLIDDLMKAQVA